VRLLGGIVELRIFIAAFGVADPLRRADDDDGGWGLLVSV
jgi:hypothetical protein